MKNNVKPISPKDLNVKPEESFPSFVIEAVNNLLKKNFRGRSLTIKQKDIVSEMLRLNPETNKDEIIENHWLDFEKVFSKNGWKVDYESPDRGDSFDSYFTFTPKK